MQIGAKGPTGIYAIELSVQSGGCESYELDPSQIDHKTVPIEPLRGPLDQEISERPRKDRQVPSALGDSCNAIDQGEFDRLVDASDA